MSTIDAIGGGVTGASSQVARGTPRKPANGLYRLMRWLAYCIERRRTRMALLELTDDQLSDIGISRCDAYREGLRPFYD